MIFNALDFGHGICGRHNLKSLRFSNYILDTESDNRGSHRLSPMFVNVVDPENDLDG